MTHKFPLNQLSTVMRHEVIGLINIEKRKAYKKALGDFIKVHNDPEHSNAPFSLIINHLVKIYDPKL